MDYNSIRQDLRFQDWSKYAPSDMQYVLFSDTNPSIVAAGHKIEDVYYCFSRARFDFLSAGVNSYSDLCGDNDLSNKFVKSEFLINALIGYAICFDLSWQVVWSYVQPTSFEYLIMQKYKDIEKECTRDNLLAQLNCAIFQRCQGSTKAEKLKQIIIDFDNDSDVIMLRKIYNQLKHNGTVHFEELGIQLDSMMMTVDERKINTLSRPSYSFECFENILNKYHNKFVEYFNLIINEIMPSDYFVDKVSFEDYIKISLKMDATLNKNT